MRHLLAALICILLAAPAVARTITVDNDGPADFKDIHAAVDHAIYGDTVVINPGTYSGADNCGIDFDGKAITVCSTDPYDSDIVGATVIDCDRCGRAFIFQSGEGPNSIVAGLTIINSFSDEDGGAIYCLGSGPTIKNCIMTANFALRGGAIWCEAGSNPEITECQLTENSGDFGGAAYFLESAATITRCVFRHNFTIGHSAGALRSYQSNLIISDCAFVDNSCYTYGGAIFCSNQSKLILDNCSFIGNNVLRADPDKSHGGALICESATIANCLFAGNSALVGGALIGTGTWGSSIVLSNCTFAGNYAPQGSTIYVGGGVYGSPSILVRNCVVRDAQRWIETQDNSPITIIYSNISGLWPGDGNMDADPFFVDPGCWAHSNDANMVVEPNDPNAAWVHGDYHLKSQAGRWDSDSQAWIYDDVTSPCIDAGDPNTPIGPELFPNGGRINMGAYGGTAEASKSYFLQPTCDTIVAGDINGDCKIDATDFSFIADHWFEDNRISSPDRAANPNPANGAKGIATNPVLSWTIGPGAVSHDVYFGTTAPGDFRGSRGGTTFAPGILDYNRVYYWRVDEVNEADTTTGTIWSFETESPPRTASNPNPPDGSVGARLDPVLSWESGYAAVSHDVYFGAAYPPDFQTNQTANTFTPGLLSNETTYYWRIDEISPYETTTGGVWTFKTITYTPR